MFYKTEEKEMKCMCKDCKCNCCGCNCGCNCPFIKAWVQIPKSIMWAIKMEIKIFKWILSKIGVK